MVFEEEGFGTAMAIHPSSLPAICHDTAKRRLTSGLAVPAFWQGVALVLHV
jgi:hypothetical protein